MNVFGMQCSAIKGEALPEIEKQIKAFLGYTGLREDPTGEKEGPGTICQDF